MNCAYDKKFTTLKLKQNIFFRSDGLDTQQNFTKHKYLFALFSCDHVFREV